MSGVLTGDKISFPECFNCAQGDIPKIPDRSWDKGNNGYSGMVFRCHQRGER